MNNKPQLRFQGFNEEWEQRRFGSMIEEKRERTIKENEDVLLSCAINGMFLNTELFSHFRGSSNIGYLKVEKNDLILSAQNLHLGNCNVNLRFKSGIISPAYKTYHIIGSDPNFIQAWIKQDKTKNFFLMATTEGASACRKNVMWEELYKQTFSVPSINEQTAIGNLFQHLDKIIQHQNNIIYLLKQIKQFYLKKIFPNQYETTPVLRFQGFEDKWEEQELKNITTIHARIGWQNLRTSEFLDNGEYLLITGTDFNNGHINYNTCHYVLKDRYDQDKNIQVKNGNILLTKDGTLGKVAIVDNLNRPATLNAGVFNIEIINNLADNLYLFQYLSAPFLMNYVKDRATGGTIKHLNQNIIVDFPVNIPSLSEQTKIGNLFQHLDKIIQHQNKIQSLFKQIKNFYLQKMFPQQ